MTSIRTDSQTTVSFEQFQKNLMLDQGQNVGQGVNGQGGDAPPAVPQETIANALASLAGFLSGGAGMDIEVLLVQVAVAMRDTEADNQKAKIKTDEEAKRAQLQEKEAKLEEAQRKMEEAEAKKREASLIDKIKLAFEWLGAILAVAVAAVMIATGVGAVVGGLLIAAAVVAIIMAIDATVTATTDMGIAGNLLKLSNPDATPEQIAQADTGFRIAMAVLGIALTLAAGGASVAGAVKSAASSIKDGLSAAKDAFFAAMKESGSAISQGAKIAQRVVAASEALVAAGVGASEIGKSVIKNDETELRAEGKQLEAKAKQNEALIQMLDDFIDQALSRLLASSDRFNQMLDDITENMADRGNSLSRAKFGI